MEAQTPQTPEQTYQPTAAPAAVPPKPPKQPSNYKVSWPVVFVITLIVFAALGAWQYVRTSKVNSQLSAKEEQIQTKQKEITQLTAERDKALNSLTTTAGALDYIAIPEWGVKFKPGTDLQDFLYLMDNGSVQPSTKSLMQLALTKKGTTANSAYDAICSPAAMPIGVIQRGKSGTQFQGTTYEKIPGALKVGDYYYIIVAPQAPCSGDKSVQDLQTKQTAALKEAIKSLVRSGE